MDAITWAYYGGMDGISVAHEAAGDLLDRMEGQGNDQEDECRDDGLDMSSLNTITDDEVQAFHEHYLFTKGYSIPAFELWLKFRAGILKRYRATVPYMTTAAEKKCIVKNNQSVPHQTPCAPPPSMATS